MSAVAEQDDARHCTRLDAGERWRDAALPNAAYAANGEALDVSISVFERGQQSGSAAAGEEVAAVLEGQFEIDAAGEHYVLSPGEGIVIPPGEPRQWHCMTARGVLYRVVVRA